MKKGILIFNALMLMSIFAFAQTAKTTAKKTTVSQIASDAVKYEKNNTAEEIVVNGKDLLLSGSDNQLTIVGNVGKILITGKNNDITIIAVNEITITGSGNFVSWEKTNNGTAKPIILDKGGYNNVEKRSGNAQTKDEN